MVERNALLELCELENIQTRYYDMRGNEQTPPEATLRALLADMGIDASGEAAAEQALQARLAAARGRALPPVIVIGETAPAQSITIYPDALAQGALSWRIVEESGAERGGHIVRADLQEVDAQPGAVRWVLASPLPCGYHRFELFIGGKQVAHCLLVIFPERCFQPQSVRNDGRVFGPALQLYALRSDRNWGIGDFTDLLTVVEQWAARGAGVIGINPLHALFLHDPDHASPYSPSSRLFLNVLYIDVEHVADFRESDAAREFVRSPEVQNHLAVLRREEFVDYAAIAKLKLRALELSYAGFRERHLSGNTQRAGEFRAYQAQGGELLHLQALYDALAEHFHRQDPSAWRWQQWPEGYRDARSPAVAQFGAENRDRVEFFQYMQWQAESQLAEVGYRCLEIGLGVGLFLDLALAPDRGGAESWMRPGLFAQQAAIGSPPDDFNASGQNWGLPPPIPDQLPETRYEEFIQVLRKNMRHAGALRIDHVMALMRLFWIPAGGAAANGTYVGYPFEDMLGIVALESQRNQCMVIGEDLGTVPDEVRGPLRETGVLSYKVLYFEKDDRGEFKQPADFLRQAVVVATTHDLPTIAAFWCGHDLQLRTELGLLPADDMRNRLVLERAQDRVRLVAALEREGLLPAGSSSETLAMPELSEALMIALHVYIARAPTQLMLVQLEDMEGAIDGVNLPGTTDEYPNWRRRLKTPIEHWPRLTRFTALTEALAAVRGPGTVPEKRGQRRARPAVIPRATYRLQFNAGFGFAQATELVEYLSRLGISHVYASPLLRARAGSTHGYDIIDHNALNPELGSQEDFERWIEALHAHGMGMLLDIVPNHMGVLGADNRWWLDVLENGPASSFAGFFDIDWTPVNTALAGRVVIPVLGDQYGIVLRRGELQLAFDEHAGAFSLNYYEHPFPIDPREYPRVLSRALRFVPPGMDPGATAEFESLIGSFGHLPSRHETAPEKIAARNRDKEVHKSQLARVARDPAIREMIAQAIAQLNGIPGENASFDALHELLDAQAYRLSYWRVASDEINYRRFFDINELAALRMESEAVFEATHERVMDMLVKGQADGLRIDHSDGLYDPAQYLKRLQDRYAALTRQPPESLPLYVVVEKITARYEYMPADWQVYGTTGYRFANLVNGLFVDTRAQRKIDRIYSEFIGESLDLEEIIYRAKRQIMRTALAGELQVLASQLWRISQANRDTRDYTLNACRQALEEVVACFPVYRTYISQSAGADDRRYIDWAVARARGRSRAADITVFGFLRDVLTTDAVSDDPAFAELVFNFVGKFQQYTSPVTAKGVEDTAFYVYNRLTSLNEVGGDPASFGVSPSAFHVATLDRAQRWPHTMLAGSTHDSKRSADVRARIDALTEMPGRWRLALSRLARIARSRKHAINEQPVPSRNEEYLFYQTLLGVWPFEPLDDRLIAQLRERLCTYMVKAVREAKINSSWINVNEEYEAAIVSFVEHLISNRPRNLFLREIDALARRVSWIGLLNSLSATLIQFATPGVPDIYQGGESWLLTLVDPDNRGAVDFAKLRGMFDALEREFDGKSAGLAQRAGALMEAPEDGRPKLYLIWRLLQLRRECPDVFQTGTYQALEPGGEYADNLLAFARRGTRRGAIACAPRLVDALVGDERRLPHGERVWADTWLNVSTLGAGDSMINALTGEQVAVVERDGQRLVRVAEVLAHFPVALLCYEELA